MQSILEFSLLHFLIFLLSGHRIGSISADKEVISQQNRERDTLSGPIEVLFLPKKKKKTKICNKIYYNRGVFLSNKTLNCPKNYQSTLVLETDLFVWWFGMKGMPKFANPSVFFRPCLYINWCTAPVQQVVIYSTPKIRDMRVEIQFVRNYIKKVHTTLVFVVFLNA